ncbi:type II toxin-antitoxin system Phd/YefM family antitoxin [Georgenia subflava]|uniref:Antitoxin n=1 Tax=Georgenia subflava TaxID=1622177 RepID=A0A6N7EDV5_9MICO|nr:type II toxin-antitoxin system Phd/YefM family antitoxin [Georgenia subflava]MPV36289.1 type II toxin-antitoxin system prevent-host-death family antitoxin [Georgenia subflava]
MSGMNQLSVSQARERLAAVIEQATTNHRPVYISRRGKRVAAIIDAAELDRITELAEDMEDVLAAEAAREEMRATAQEPIPWEEVKADLGLS